MNYYPRNRGFFPQGFGPGQAMQMPQYRKFSAAPLANRRNRRSAPNNDKNKKPARQAAVKPVDASKLLVNQYNTIRSQLTQYIKTNGKYLQPEQKQQLHRILPESNESRVVVAGQAVLPFVLHINPKGMIKAEELRACMELISSLCMDLSKALDPNHSYGKGAKVAINDLAFTDNTLVGFRNKGFVLTTAAETKYLKKRNKDNNKQN